MKKVLFLSLFLLCTMGAWADAVHVSSWEELVAATNGDNPEIVLDRDIKKETSSDTFLDFGKYKLKNFTLDLNGHSLERQDYGLYEHHVSSDFSMIHVNYGSTLTIINEQKTGYIESLMGVEGVINRTIQSEGTLNLIGVKVLARGPGAKQNISVENGGTALVKDSKIIGYLGYCSTNYFINSEFTTLMGDRSEKDFGLELRDCTGLIINSTINGYKGKKKDFMGMVRGQLKIDGRDYNPQNDNFDEPFSYKHIYKVVSDESQIPETKIVAMASEPGRGSVTGGGTYKLGERYTIEATPVYFTRVAYWNVPGVNVGQTTVKGVAGSSEMYVVNFENIPLYQVIAEVYPKNSCTITGANDAYYEGETVDVTVTPNPGYRVSEFQLFDKTHNYTQLDELSYHVDHIDCHKLFSITCRKVVPFTVRTNDASMGEVILEDGEGNVIQDNGDGTIDEGRGVVLKAKAKAGYKFSNWSDGDFNDTRNMRVTKPVHLVANFVSNDAEIPVGVQIKGRDITMSNANDVMGDGGSIKFDIDKRTLYLNNATIISDDAYAPALNVESITGDFYINLTGESYIRNLGSPSVGLGTKGSQQKLNIYIQGPGTLKIYNENGAAIWASTNTFVNVEDNAYINIHSGNVVGENGSRGFHVSESKMYVGGLEGQNSMAGFKTISLNGVHFNDRLKFDKDKMAVVMANGTYCTTDFIIYDGTYFDASLYRLHELTLFANDDQMGDIVGGEYGRYQNGEVITLNAIPSGDKYTFQKWSDNVTDAERTITMGNKDKTLMAIFELKANAKGGFLTVKSNDEHMGTVDFGETTWYREGTKVQVSATNKYGFVFDSWSDGVTADTRNVTMGTKDIELTAIFVHPQMQSKPEAVDLGLPSGTLWANVNIGAENDTEEGSYFAWGEVYPRDHFSENEYFFFDENGEYSKYTEESGYMDYCDNAAAVLWGDDWTMPQSWQFKELYDMCDIEFYPEEGYAVFKSKINGASIRLTLKEERPEYGKCESSYWELGFDSVDIDGKMIYYASFISIDNGVDKCILRLDRRYKGRLIRPVTSGSAMAYYDYTGITTPTVNNTAVSKFVKNGRVLIRHNDRTYNVLGIEEK